MAIPKEKIENILSQNKNKKLKRNNSSSIEKSNITIISKNNKNINKKNQIPLYQRKMFVGGLHSSLTTESLRNYFSQFGKIDKIIIMNDKVTGKSRGFGFIIFSEKETIDKILSYANCHFLYGKWIECKRAQPKINYVSNKSLKNFLLPDNVNFNSNQNNSLNNNKNKLFNYFRDTSPNENISLSLNNNNTNFNNNNEINTSLNNNLYLQLLPNNNDKINNQEQFFKNKFLYDKSNIIINKKLDNEKFQDYFNKYIKNPSWYNYFHYKLFDFGGKDVSNLNNYKINSEKIKLFPEERDDKKYSSNSNSFEIKSDKEKEEKTIIEQKEDLIKSMYGPAKSKNIKSNDCYKPY